jgi:Cu+-exporting ATPase
MKSRFNRCLPVLVGAAAALGLLGFYAGLMTLTAGWYFAKIQFEEYHWWIVALSLGFGVQSALFIVVKRRFQGLDRRKAASSMAASGGLSSGAMVACCLHHLADIVPILGLPVLAVTLQQYQDLLFLIGVVANVFGISFMLRLLIQQRRLRISAPERTGASLGWRGSAS